MTIDTEEISRIARRALKRFFPRASRITVDSIRPVKTAMTWKSAVLSVQCSLILSGRKQTVKLFGGWDKESPVSKKQAYRVLAFLRNNGFSRSPLLVPQPLVFNARKALLLYISYPGETVYRLLPGILLKQLQTLLSLTGRWAARMHRLRASGVVPPIKDADDIIQHKRNRATFRGRGSDFFKEKNVSPETLSAELFRKRTHIRKGLTKQSLIHNDLHLRNILANKAQNEIAVIDFNESRLGDPMDDAGTFLVHLEAELSRRFSRIEIRRLQKAFLASYLKERKRPFSKREEARLAISAGWTAMRFLQYTLESNPPFPHKHNLRKPLCKIEERFWSIARHPEHFIFPLL